ncbi:MAG: hypothetical protein ACP5VP_00940 [Candidatus Limnocylindrales bacterium]
MLGLAALALVAACSSTPPASPGASASSGAVPASGLAGAQQCAWPQEVDAYSSNTVIPDTADVVWIDSFSVAPGLRIFLSGIFPDARYASLQVYDRTGAPFTRDGAGSTLSDYQIAPDPGSVNPWQRQAAPGGHFTVTLREDVAPGQVNTIPLAPAGTSSGRGILVYRVYLPAGGDISKVPLPSMSLEQGSRSESLAPCTSFYTPLTAPRSASSAAPTPTATPTASPSPTQRVNQLQFFKANIDTLAPNVDTPYVLSYLTPPGPGDVVVIRARAPTHATGDHPSPWPAAHEDVRYWSLCIALATGVVPTVMNLTPSGGIDTGCRADDQVKLDAAGDYALVLGTEAQRATILGVADTTFLPFSAAQPATTHLLMFRFMLVNPSFVYSPARVAQGNDPAATAAVMGPYYPRAAICPLSRLVAAGVSGCFT